MKNKVCEIANDNAEQIISEIENINLLQNILKKIKNLFH